MTLFESLFHPQLLFALAVFGLVSVLVEVVAYKVLLVVADVPPSHWLVAHTILPGARALALVCFILVAYPVLFGVESAPAIGTLLAGGQLRLTSLVNVVFLLSLLLPLVPLFSRWPAVVLPLQAIAASGMVFHWLADSHSITDIHYWPDHGTLLSLLFIAFITHALAKWLSLQLEKRIDRLIDRRGSEPLIYRSVVMLMQVPVILLYTLTLGRQLHYS
ncbi:MAG TPA: hypothetical protein ENI97_06840 [Gammaproteobacteria bacterium]|nr:hypothetical protein [Gammaproteobacteria bacterium]